MRPDRRRHERHHALRLSRMAAMQSVCTVASEAITIYALCKSISLGEPGKLVQIAKLTSLTKITYMQPVPQVKSAEAYRRYK